MFLRGWPVVEFRKAFLTPERLCWSCRNVWPDWTLPVRDCSKLEFMWVRLENLWWGMLMLSVSFWAWFSRMEPFEDAFLDIYKWLPSREACWVDGFRIIGKFVESSALPSKAENISGGLIIPLARYSSIFSCCCELLLPTKDCCIISVLALDVPPCSVPAYRLPGLSTFPSLCSVLVYRSFSFFISVVLCLSLDDICAALLFVTLSTTIKWAAVALAILLFLRPLIFGDYEL